MKRKASILLTMLLCFGLLWKSIKPAEAAQVPLTSLTFDFPGPVKGLALVQVME